MAHLRVSNLSYSPPGAGSLFSEVSFTVAPGEHAGLVGPNGVGKTTLMRILAGQLTAEKGSVSLGEEPRYMAQDVGVSETCSIREMLLRIASPTLRRKGEALIAAEQAAGEGGASAGTALAEAIYAWGEAGGHQLEGRWDVALRRTARRGLTELADVQAQRLSGGERKSLLLEVLFADEGSLLLLDEPDNFLDIPAKRRLETMLEDSPKTVLLISHDRELLSEAVDKIVTLEPTNTWVHGDSYATYDTGRDHRRQLLAGDLHRWHEEERRLFRHYKIMKQRAALNSRNASKANAAETRWRRFAEAGPPPAPFYEHRIRPRLQGGDSARVVVSTENLALAGLILPFTTRIYFGERVGVIGPNGSGKTHLLHAIDADPLPHAGEVRLGNRVSAGRFIQTNVNPAFSDKTALEIVQRITRGRRNPMSALARYGLQGTAKQRYETLSGGQKARLEILTLELEGHNLLLLDEPTDNLDIESAAALEKALVEFTGTIISISHDRAYLRRLDRFLILLHSGNLYETRDYDEAIAELFDPPARRATLLTVP